MIKKNGECCIGDLGLSIRYDPIQGQIDKSEDNIRVGTKPRVEILLIYLHYWFVTDFMIIIFLSRYCNRYYTGKLGHILRVAVKIWFFSKEIHGAWNIIEWFGYFNIL